MNVSVGGKTVYYTYCRQIDRQLSCTAQIHGTLSLNMKAQISENPVWACLAFELANALCIPLFTILSNKTQSEQIICMLLA